MRLEVVLEAYLGEVDAGIRLADAAVRKVLQAQAKVVVTLVAEAVAGADVVAELEVRAHLLGCRDVLARKVMEPDRAFDVGPIAGLALEAERRGQADVGDVACAVPPSQLHVPVGAEVPVALVEPFLVPVPLQPDAAHADAVSASAFDRPAIHGARLTGEQESSASRRGGNGNSQFVVHCVNPPGRKVS